MAQKNILAVSDISCVGKCSLTVALPILSSNGFAVSVLPTAVLSAHTAFPSAKIVPMTDCLEGFIASWNSMEISFDGIMTGYLASEKQVDIISKLFDMYPKAPRIVDPVMADHGKLYRGFSPAFPREMRRLCSHADIVIPNLTEAALLTGAEYREDGGNADELGKGLLELGAKSAVITGISGDNGTIGAAVYEPDGCEKVFSPRREGHFHGTGDIFSAVLTASLLKGCALAGAAKAAADFVSFSIANTDPSADSRYGVAFEDLLT